MTIPRPVICYPTVHVLVVPVWSGVNVGGVRLSEVCPHLGTQDDFEHVGKLHQEVVNRLVRCTAACRQDPLTRRFQNAFFCIFHVSASILILCHNILAEKLLQSTFCDQTLYLSNVCRVMSRITEVALLNNF